MKLLLDMNLAPRWAGWLEQRGFQADHWSLLGKATASDSEIMVYAANHGYVVITHDLDFGTILAATNAEKPSVIQIRADNTSPELIGDRVVTALQKMNTELLAGALVTIDLGRDRVRVLPLQR